MDRWALFLGLVLAQGVRLGLAFGGALIPLGLAGFVEAYAAEGPLFRLGAGYDYVGSFARVELGYVLQEDGARRRWLSAGDGAYLKNAADPPGRLLHGGTGVYDGFQNLGLWGGVMRPATILNAEARPPESGAGLAVFSLLRLRLEFAGVAVSKR